MLGKWLAIVFSSSGAKALFSVIRYLCTLFGKSSGEYLFYFIREVHILLSLNSALFSHILIKKADKRKSKINKSQETPIE